MKILVIGAGGREHALAWKLSASPCVISVHVAPGNAGTALLNPIKVFNVPEISDALPIPLIVEYASKNMFDLVVPGSEATLVNGIADALAKVGIKCFGPSKYASQIEGSKAFSKLFMRSNGIPTADFRVFSSYDLAVEYVKSLGDKRYVIKASGPALGKGVVLPQSTNEAISTLKLFMVDRIYGESGATVVIEDFISGEEVSVLAFSDGHTVIAMPPAQDHKRVGDADTGPNTGGMGAYAPACPASVRSPTTFVREITSSVLKRVVDAFRRTRNPFVGVLYAGIIVTPSGHPYVLEFNARFGDPETQALLPLLESNLAEIMVACCNGYLDAVEVSFSETDFSCAVVLAAQGYPGNYKKGIPLRLQAEKVSGAGSGAAAGRQPKSYCFVAGAVLEVTPDASSSSSSTVPTSPPTAANKDSSSIRVNAFTTGGRVLAVVARRHTLRESVEAAYSLIPHFAFDALHYRTDIAHRGLKRASSDAKAKGLTYSATGVSIDRGNDLVEQIKRAVSETSRPGSSASIGGFGGVFDLAQAGFKHPYIPIGNNTDKNDNGTDKDSDNDTMLVASTDGVGTKLRIALETGSHDTIGQDLVAMSVNDVVVTGATPLFFLDYYACGELDVQVTTRVIKGVARACAAVECALVGGETAEMPSMYARGDYDLAGFAVGAVRRAAVLPHLEKMQDGDLVFGIPSSGVHSNGFSMVRSVVQLSGLPWDAPAPFAVTADAVGDNSNNNNDDGCCSLGAALLVPTRLYVRPVLELARAGLVKGAAHITGGGLIENVPRILPAHLAAHLDGSKWAVPGVFSWLQKVGDVPHFEMLRTFNCGIGMVLIVSAFDAACARQLVPDLVEIGVLVQRNDDSDPPVHVKNISFKT